MNEPQDLAPCSCAIDCFPPTTSIVGCAEHGLPQNLEETEYPGASPKGAVLLVKPKSKEVIAIAPIYGSEQATRVRQRGEELGFRFAETVTIYSPTDLERVETMDDVKVATELSHKPGCIFTERGHPGDCYVESSQAAVPADNGAPAEATGFWNVDSDGTWTPPGPSGTKDGLPDART